MISAKPDFSFERKLLDPVVGLDEAGCGPWAGPVVAGAVIFLASCDECAWISLIRDSKQLSPKRRGKIFEHLMDDPRVLVGLGRAEVDEIDAMNIGQATRLAMRRAVANLPDVPSSALVDGIRDPGLTIPTTLVVKGDQRSLSIAAASIAAKVTRDHTMRELDRDFPAYGWKTNAGYGTAVHQRALQEHGVTIHHRRSFAPIARLLEERER